MRKVRRTIAVRIGGVVSNQQSVSDPRLSPQQHINGLLRYSGQESQSQYLPLFRADAEKNFDLLNICKGTRQRFDQQYSPLCNSRPNVCRRIYEWYWFDGGNLDLSTK